MMKQFSLLACLACVESKFDDSGYLGWFAESLVEVDDAALTFTGALPDYVRGTFVQGGPAKFSMGDYTVGHVFDGFAKNNIVRFSGNTTTFTSKFTQSEFLKQSIKQNRIATATLIGETVPNSQSSRVLVGAMDGHNDNNYIKAHKVGGQDMMLSDTTTAQCFSEDWAKLNETIRPLVAMTGLPNGHRWTDTDASIAGHMCMTGIMAHGFTDAETGVYTGVMGCSSMMGPLEKEYHIVYTIDPGNPTLRKPLAKIALPRGRSLSVMHSLGHTPDHVILIAHPLHMSIPAVMEGKTMTTGMLQVGNGTIFQVVSRKDGTVRTYEAPSFFSGHVINAFEDNGDVVIDFTWYHADEHLMFYGGMLFDIINNKTNRDNWPNSVLKRYRLKANGETENEPLTNDTDAVSIELPKVNEQVYGRKYCVFYAMHSHSYDYESDPSSRVPGPFGAVGIAKRNICTGAVHGMYETNVYPAEVEFIADPQGTEEDDGVLVGFVFDGNTNSSFLQVVDAKSMKRIAHASLPINVPFPVHASFFPSGFETTIIV